MPERKVNRTWATAGDGKDDDLPDLEKIEDLRIKICLLLRRPACGKRCAEVARTREREAPAVGRADSSRENVTLIVSSHGPVEREDNLPAPPVEVLHQSA